MQDEWVGRSVSESDDNECLCMCGAIGGGDGASVGDRGVRGESRVDQAKLRLVLLLVASSTGCEG